MNSQHRWLLRWLRKVGELTKFAICTGNRDLWEGFCDPFEGVDEFVIVDGKSEILRVGEERLLVSSPPWSIRLRNGKTRNDIFGEAAQIQEREQIFWFAMHHVPPSDAKFCPQETFGEGKAA